MTIGLGRRRFNSVEMFFAGSECAIEDLAKPKPRQGIEVLASARTFEFQIKPKDFIEDDHTTTVLRLHLC